MHTPDACLACFRKQLDDIVLLLGYPPGSKEEQDLRLRAEDCLREADHQLSPPEVAAGLHRMVRSLTGIPDPYRALKEQYNTLALSWYPELKERIRSAPDPLAAALRLAIAGNIIDFGVNTPVTPDSVLAALKESEDAALPPRTLQHFRDSVAQARQILYLGDNCGEIVFDRILMEELPEEKLTFAVRGNPVLNDITLEDAASTGILPRFRTIANGADAPGTPLRSCSEEFVRAYQEADMIIAKGQGNYETLCERQERLFFLFRVKCPLVEAISGLPLHSLAFLEAGGQN